MLAVLLSAATAQAQYEREQEAITDARSIAHVKVCGGKEVPGLLNMIDDLMRQDGRFRAQVTNALSNLEREQKRVGKLVFCARLEEWVREEARKPDVDICAVNPKYC
jgi:hypothetical protein